MKYRIWWLPQVGAGITSFYKEVSTIEEGSIICDILADYDLYQYDNNIKPEYCNAGGVQYFDEEEQEWFDVEEEEDYQTIPSH